MNAYELTDTFMNHVDLMMTFFMAYLSATSAYLAVAFLAGATIPTFLGRVILSIYSLASVFLIFSFQRVSTIAIGIREEMRGVASWHPAVYEPAWIIPTVMWLVVAIMLMLFISSVWYSSHVKKHAKAAT